MDRFCLFAVFWYFVIKCFVACSLNRLDLFVAPSMVREVMCVFWKAVVGVFWLLCFDWFVLVKWLCKALWVFFLALL